METNIAKRYRPIDPSLSSFPFLPSRWRRLIKGETRQFVTQLSLEECRDRLESMLSSSQLRAGRSKAIGAVGSRSFLFRLRGGLQGDVGAAPFLFGTLIPAVEGTLVTVRKAFPGVVLLPFPLFAAGTAIVALLTLLGQLSSLHGDPSGYFLGLLGLPFAIVILAFGTWVLGREMDRNHFEFLVEALEARETPTDDAAPILNWKS
jgi:hypothetical protein